MKQFGRRYQLALGNPHDGLFIDALRVSFDLCKTIDAKPNPAQICIWNLNRTHLNQLLSGTFKRVALSVGYTELRLLYTGDILKATLQRDGLDSILVLECADGDTDYRHARVSLTLKAGTSDQQAIQQLAQSLDQTQLGTVAQGRLNSLPRGRVFCGNTRDALSQIAQANQADWSIQDGELLLLPAQQVLADEATLVSQDTGMIGAPEASEDGLIVTALLNPAIRIGGLVRVHSITESFNGDYKVVSVSHCGDTYGDEWLTTITAVGGAFTPIKDPS
ncbi:hypothetical protein MCB1EB_0411 [Mycoavidus cysteinexigens]|uniref:Uncharacterized protein n=1 Tax=Mycoavidus cysteinexigens TaxID=1553431 RepID=A0A2Z6ET37_9BURK|nr:hypothetical protein [Mycoavidus cysteinexigens]BBE08572.1 hypothetical protein MCB1EB_0411 [Mycoavidus cysteinexigens]GAM52724.1 hypothetical protein EBME_1187 [bacterium endosymbiont of Mortierella elongata FMR23-6]GLR00423.1 hypothetical protein GCM10007934_02340 [Mycoavidus cysteinexigens]